ncbi:hypothetical protein AB4Z48_26620 [Cupriavidus sp. 2TAF22]|uniref:hypothetical protein n=1 Tax=unclassified Cupriavidus TaxID=2640874 RepID=UPI003F8F1EFE
MKTGGLGNLAVALDAALDRPAIRLLRLLRLLRCKLRWWAKYLIALLPVSLTYLGWWLVALLEPLSDSKGRPKCLYDCHGPGTDLTWLTGFGFFMMFVCICVATRHSCGLVIRTVAEEFAMRDSPRPPARRYGCGGRILLRPQHGDVLPSKSPHSPD